MSLRNRRALLASTATERTTDLKKSVLFLTISVLDRDPLVYPVLHSRSLRTKA